MKTEEFLNVHNIKFIWIKINDCWGFSGISCGNSINDIDNHELQDEIEKILGTTHDELYKLNNTNYLTNEMVSFLNSKGWFENDNLWKSNGDVHAYCFEYKL